MGIQESKSNLGSTANFGSTGSLRRSSLYKSSTMDQIQARHELVRSIQSDIDIFAGNRSDERYKELQQILIKTSSDLEQMKRKSGKERTRDRCDQVLREVQASIQRLEDKSAINERVDKNLDLAAVESDSFVNQSFGNKTARSYQQVNPEISRGLDDIEFQLQNLEKEVKLAIELEDTSQFILLEKKITILYGDLVMVKVDDHTPLSERCEDFERRLIGCNNQIKKCKRKMTKRLSEMTDTSKSELDVDEIDKTQKRISELELEALTFEGIKTDKRYKELEQVLERYWTKLYSTDVFTDEERTKRDQTVVQTKNVMQELRKRADENERQRKALQELNSIEQQIQVLRKEGGVFKGNSSDAEFTRLDQDARRLWANINEIQEVNDHVKRNKRAAIADIKNLLKQLSQNTKKRESQILDDAQQAQLLNQVQEFRDHWNHLNHNLTEKPLLESGVAASIIEILESVLEGLHKKVKALTVAENRKSSASLVVVRVSDNSDYVRYNSAPDLVPQQLGIPEADTTKPPPPNKTKIIAEMHRIGNDAKTLLAQIKQTNCLSDKDKETFANKLDECKINLNSLDYNKKSDTIESNKRRITKIIDEAFKSLNEKTSVTLEIMDVDAEIQYWRQQIKNFAGTSKDKQYEKIKNGLAESLIKLQVLGEKQVSRQESIQHIQQHHQELETKLAENQAKAKCAEIKRQISGEIKATVEQVQRVKAQVDRFSGTHDGILYKQIEENLKTCFTKLETFDTKSDDRLNNAKEQTKQKIQKYLTILEEKSAKQDKPQTKTEQLQKLQESNILKETQAYQRVYSESVASPKEDDQDLPHHKINAIREELVGIKEKVDKFSGRFKDAGYLELEEEIQKCLVRLNAINESGYSHVSSSKAQYVDYIEKLLQYFKDKTMASEFEDYRESDEV